MHWFWKKGSARIFWLRDESLEPDKLPDPYVLISLILLLRRIAKNKGKVTYVLYSDEGHGFARPENRIDFNARTEVFLSECLGGRAEPLTGDIYPGSTAVVRVVGQ